jgi:uncharacterized protein YchJ
MRPHASVPLVSMHTHAARQHAPHRGAAAHRRQHTAAAHQRQHTPSNTHGGCSPRRPIPLLPPLAQDCCKPQHEGAWARTAVELALARHSARLLHRPDFLVDTTHTESLEAIGGRTRQARKAKHVCAMYEQRGVALADVVHGPGDALPVSRMAGVAGLQREPSSSPGHGGSDGKRDGDGGGGASDSWLVSTALSFMTEDGQRRQDVTMERYVKLGGRWVYLCGEDAMPSVPPFDAFWERNCGGGFGGGPLGADAEDGMVSDVWQSRAGTRPDGTPWLHTFQLVAPAYARSGSAAPDTTEDEVLGGWLWDELAAEDGEPAAAPAPSPRSHRAPPRHPRRRALVYLDDYAPTFAPGDLPPGLSLEQEQALLSGAAAGPGGHVGDGGGLSVRAAAALNDQLLTQLAAMRNKNDMNYQTWLFRTGRFHADRGFMRQS